MWTLRRLAIIKYSIFLIKSRIFNFFYQIINFFIEFALIIINNSNGKIFKRSQPFSFSLGSDREEGYGSEDLISWLDRKIGDKVKAFEVSLMWNNPDGTEVYIENVDVVKDENIYDTFEETKSNKLTDEEIERLGLFER